MAMAIDVNIVVDLANSAFGGRDHGLDTDLGEVISDGVGVIALVSQNTRGAFVSRLTKKRPADLVVALARSQREFERHAVGVDLDVKFGGEAAPAAAKTLFGLLSAFGCGAGVRAHGGGVEGEPLEVGAVCAQMLEHVGEDALVAPCCEAIPDA